MTYFSCHSSRGALRLPRFGRSIALLTLLALGASLSGCGVLAAPCRVGSAVIKMVPLVGHVAAVPTDACAAVIDP